jgi:hypothetical protein
VVGDIAALFEALNALTARVTASEQGLEALDNLTARVTVNEQALSSVSSDLGDLSDRVADQEALTGQW